MEPLISLIIPVYNVEAYLERCIQSVLAQTYPNFEAILVDDGSVDRGGILCDQYAARESVLKVYHKTNGGLSDARNYGVQKASGELIAFLDSDDFISEDYLAYLYELMSKNDADIACGKMKRVMENESVIPRSAASDLGGMCLSAGDAIKEILMGNGFAVSACAKLYRRSLLMKCPFPAGRLYEDLATTYKLFAECQRVAFGRHMIYYYFKRAGSIMCQPMDDNQLYGLTAAAEILEFVRERYPVAEEAAQVRCALKCVQYLPQIVVDPINGKHYFMIIRQFLLPHLKVVLKCKEKAAPFKLCCILIWLGYTPTKLVYPVSANLLRRMRKVQE